MALRIYAFAPAFGLKTAGPFALKLLTWCDLHAIPYEQAAEDNSGKGPLKKSPWAEIDGEVVADSDRIVARLAQRHGIPLPRPDTPEGGAAAAFKLGAEEGIHQILEWELFFHPEGIPYLRDSIRASMPPVMGPVVARLVSRHFRRQLLARGIARLTPEEILAKGRTYFDGLESWLAHRPFLDGDRPDLNDCAVYGQAMPMLHWPMATPLARHLRTLPRLRDWTERLRAAAEATAARP